MGTYTVVDCRQIFYFSIYIAILQLEDVARSLTATLLLFLSGHEP